MKQLWVLSFLILWFANLFFIGLLVGRFFQSQNPEFKNDVLRNGPTIEDVKLFKVRITDASLRVLDRLDAKWRDLIDYTLRLPKSGLFFRIGASGRKEFAGDSASLEVGNKYPISNIEVNLPVEINDPVDDTPRKLIDYRIDPFLEIAALKKAAKPKPAFKTGPGNDKRSGPVFEPKKIPETVAVPEEVTVKVNPLDKIRLRGIVIGETKTAYIENMNQYEKVTIGDMVAGGKVIDISKQSVTIQMGDQQIVLTAEGAK